jgi:hypothetical protein
MTIYLTPSTQYGTGWRGSAATAGKSSITVNSHILAEGTVSADGKSLAATRVTVLPAGSMQPTPRGYPPGGDFFGWRGRGSGFFSPQGHGPGFTGPWGNSGRQGSETSPNV